MNRCTGLLGRSEPCAGGGRPLPRDRWLPGLGARDCGLRHFVPAGTLPIHGERDHYRAPAACWAETLRMPESAAMGATYPRYEYERHPLCPECVGYVLARFVAAWSVCFARPMLPAPRDAAWSSRRGQGQGRGRGGGR
jgi:hypothetical protein